MAQFYTPKRRAVVRQALRVTAQDLDPFGQGVAHYQGKTLFISGLLPGEHAEIVLTDEKKHLAKGVVKRLLSQSPDRVLPRCPYFERCGGCQQQHASVALQQHSKSNALKRLLTRECGVSIEPESIIADQDYGYRRRARLGLQFHHKTQKLVMGFRQANSNALVDIEQCPILVEKLSTFLPPLRACLTALCGRRRIGHVELVYADNGISLVLRHLDALNVADQDRLQQFGQQYNTSIFLDAGRGDLHLLCGVKPHYWVDGLTLVFSPQDFIQVNAGVNQQMVAQALEWLDIQPSDKVLDLFCGMGNFTLPIARRAQQVVGIEGVEALVEMAKHNAGINGLKNVAFYHHNLVDPIAGLPWAQCVFDKVLLDPARAGALAAMEQIVRLAPKRVVYVSCNPATLARDSKKLLDAGFKMTSVRMLDMFPHTGHLESMVLFQRTSTRSKR